MSEFGESHSPGAVIAAARRQRGWTLDDLSERTKIPTGMLAALEADEFHRLSGPLYARSFLRTCAKELGLAVEDVLELMDRQKGEAPRPAAAPAPKPETVKIRRVGTPWGRLAAGAVAVCGVAATIVLLARQGGEGSSPAPGATGGAQAAATGQQPRRADGGPTRKEADASAGGGVTAVTPAETRGIFADGLAWPLVVRLVAAAPVPLAVRRDGEAGFAEISWATAASDTLPAIGIEAGRAYAQDGGGAVVVWGAVNRVSLRLGTVQGVTLTVNGRARALVAPPGGGEVTVDLTAVDGPALP